MLAETRGTGIPAARANLFYTHCAGCFGGELGCSGAELRAPETAVECALRDSLKVHPEFFRQKVRVVHETAELVVVDKPFDTQIGAGAGQRPRWPGEITVEETIRGRGNAVAPHRVHEEPPPPSSRRVRPGKQPPPPKKRGTVVRALGSKPLPLLCFWPESCPLLLRAHSETWRGVHFIYPHLPRHSTFRSGATTSISPHLGCWCSQSHRRGFERLHRLSSPAVAVSLKSTLQW